MRTGSQIAENEATSLTNAGLRKAVGDDFSFNMGAIARDAFGNALGSSIGQGIVQMTGSEDRRQRTEFT